MVNLIEVLNTLQLIVVWIYRKFYFFGIEKMHGADFILSSFLSDLTNALVLQFKNELISEVIEATKYIIIKTLLQQQKIRIRIFVSSFGRKMVNLLFLER